VIKPVVEGRYDLMKKNKALSILLALAMMVSIMPGAFAKEIKKPYYEVNAQLDQASGVVEARVTAGGMQTTGGRIAINYDETVLTLLQNDGQTPVTQEFIDVKDTEGQQNRQKMVDSRNENVKFLLEGYDNNQLTSIEKGYILIPWITSKVLDVTSGVEVMGLYFKLNEGKTADDINMDTFQLEMQNLPDTATWDSCAELIEVPGVIQYKFAHSKYDPLRVSFNYEGDDKPAEGASQVRISVVDSKKASTQAEVSVAGKTYTTDADGKVVFYLKNGTYTVNAVKDGHNQTIEEISAPASGEKQIMLLTYKEYLEKLADGFDIEYAEGDSANHITKPVTLRVKVPADPTVAVSWETSNAQVIQNIGVPVTQEKDAKATLTATLEKGDVTVKKDFAVTVKGTNNGTEPTTSPSTSPTAKPTSSPGNPGGGGGPSGGTPKPTTSPTTSPTATPTASPTTSPKPTKNFTDIDSVPWAKEQIEYLASEGIIKGTSDTTFSPNDSIKRGDYITLLVRMLKLDETVSDNFADVPADSYYYHEIGVAKKLGMTNGIGDNLFSPDAPVTRQDMMTMTTRALQAIGQIADNSIADNAILDRFTDKGEISEYALPSVAYVVENGYITGNGAGEIQPKNNTTRAETAVFMYRLYTKEK
jgi:hypothetical protein